MNKFVKISSAAFLATVLAVPGTAAFAASVTSSNAIAMVSAVPGDNLTGVIGNGSADLIASFGNSDATVRLVDIHDVYTGDAVQEAEDVLQSTKRWAVSTLQNDLANDADASAWLASQGIDPAQVVGVEQDGNAVNLYLL